MTVFRVGATAAVINTDGENKQYEKIVHCLPNV